MTGKAKKAGPKDERQEVPPTEPVTDSVAQRLTQAYDEVVNVPDDVPMPGDGQFHKWDKKDSPQVRATVLRWLAKGWTKGLACEKAGIHPTTLKRWRADDPEFDEQVTDAIERGTDVLENAAIHRAVHGTPEPVFQQGECVGHKVVYSDQLLAMVLGGRRTRFARQRIEHTGEDGKPILQRVEVEFVKAEGSD